MLQVQVKNIIDISYDIFTLLKYLNFINLITYDFYEKKRYGKLYVTGANAPLHPQQDATGNAREYTIEYAVNY